MVLGPDISTQIVRICANTVGLLCPGPTDPARSKVYLCLVLLLYWACLYKRQLSSFILMRQAEQLLKYMQHPLVICIFWTAGMVSGNSHLHSGSRSYLWCESPRNNTWHTHNTEIQNWFNWSYVSLGRMSTIESVLGSRAISPYTLLATQMRASRGQHTVTTSYCIYIASTRHWGWALMETFMLAILVFCYNDKTPSLHQVHNIYVTVVSNK